MQRQCPYDRSALFLQYRPIEEPIKIAGLNPTVGWTGGCKTMVTIMGENFRGKTSFFRLNSIHERELNAFFFFHSCADDMQVMFGAKPAPIIKCTNAYLNCLAPPFDDPCTVQVTILSNRNHFDENRYDKKVKKYFEYSKGVLKSPLFSYRRCTFLQFRVLL
jgi:hypothetical protein